MIQVGVAVPQEIDFPEYVFRAGIKARPARLAVVRVQADVLGLAMARPAKSHR